MSAAFTFVLGCNPDFVIDFQLYGKTWKATCDQMDDDFALCYSDGSYGAGWSYLWDEKLYETFDDLAVNGETPLVCPQCGCKEGNL